MFSNDSILRVIVLAAVLVFLASSSVAQDQSEKRDSLWTIDIPPVVVITATKSETRLRDVPVLTKVVTAEEARIVGALRLTDLLAEQTGISIVHDFGAGVQLQGFDSAYTLILLDGEPIIGRTAGTLDLSRLPVGLIDQVEIVHGPSSSLYGSEALAGVINIITRRPRGGVRFSSSAHYETNETTDVSTALELGSEKIRGRVQYNRFASTGYDLTPSIIGLTAPGFSDHTLSGRLTYEPSDRSRIEFGGRFANLNQSNTLGFEESGVVYEFKDDSEREDWSMSPKIRHRIGDRAILSVRGHFSSFYTKSLLAGNVTDDPSDQIDFRQGYTKGEAQLDLIGSTQHLSTVGGGYISETVTTERVTGGKRTNRDVFVYVQHQWLPADWLQVTGSGRIDAHSDYDTRLSPKLASLVKLNESTRFRASVGSGFKAPSFQQLYMDFTNPVAGYSVVGATDIEAAIERFENLGQIAFFLSNPATIGQIKPETSFSLNVGAEKTIGSLARFEINLFRNNVQDLIETLPVASKFNGQNIFTYVNLNRIYTQGMDVDLRFTPSDRFSLGVGYQFLDTADLDVVDKIEAGEMFKRVDGRDRRIGRNEYGGLFNRSRHSGTLRLTYTDSGRSFSAALRFIYRGKYGLGDLNGNLILDDASEYVPGYLTTNLTMTKSISPLIQVQLGVKNLFGETNPNQIPSLPGRLIFGGLNIHLER